MTSEGHPLSKGSVTVEDEDELDLTDDEYASSSNGQTAAGHANGASSDADRSGLAPAEESAFDIWLRNNINTPLLNHVPEWVNPNHISYVNTLACWLAFFLSYLAYTYEHVYPDGAVAMRLGMVALIWSSMVLDCLDGMQARKTGRCSKLGELLDHALDSANIPLCSCAVLMTLMPDQYTILISLIGGVMIYNAQLVIYRHQHVFVLPPVTGPVAQALACAAMLAFTLFFRFFDRHAYVPTLLIIAFAIGGNITQMQNTYFFTTRLVSHKCVWPHVRFATLMIAHGLMLPLGYMSVPVYMLSATVLAFCLNGRYVLDTLVSFKPFTPAHTRESVRREDSHWRSECAAALVALMVLGGISGRGDAISGDDAVTKGGMEMMANGAFELVHAAFMIGCVVLNVLDLQAALPQLEAK